MELMIYIICRLLEFVEYREQLVSCLSNSAAEDTRRITGVKVGYGILVIEASFWIVQS